MGEVITQKLANDIVTEVERGNYLIICEAPNGCGKTAAMCIAITKLLSSYKLKTNECAALVICPNNDSAYYTSKKFTSLCAGHNLSGVLLLPRNITANTKMESILNVNIVVAPLTLTSIFVRKPPKEFANLRFLIIADCFRSVSAWTEYERYIKDLRPKRSVFVIGLTAKLNHISRDMCRSVSERLAPKNDILTKVTLDFLKLLIFDF